MEKDNQINRYVCDVFELSDQELDATKAFHRGKKNKIAFLGHILNNHKVFSLKREAYGQICTTNVAVGLGITARSVCNYLKELRKLNWLSIENDFYIVGHQSKGYVCIGLALREMYVSRFPSKSSEAGLKKAKLVEKRREAWKANKQVIKDYDTVMVSQTEDTVITVIETPREIFQAYTNISKLYLGNHLDLIRDVNSFLTKNRKVDAHEIHRNNFYRSSKMLHKSLKITKKFTHDDFMVGRCGIRSNYLFSIPRLTAASSWQRQG